MGRTPVNLLISGASTPPAGHMPNLLDGTQILFLGRSCCSRVQTYILRTPNPVIAARLTHCAAARPSRGPQGNAHVSVRGTGGHSALAIYWVFNALFWSPPHADCVQKVPLLLLSHLTMCTLGLREAAQALRVMQQAIKRRASWCQGLAWGMPLGRAPRLCGA